MVLDPNLKNGAEKLLRDFGTYVDVFLRASTAKGTNYNPKYATGETITNQNPVSIKAYVRDKNSDSLIINKLGLVAVGSKEIVVKANDASYFMNARKVQINGEDYEIYNKATGNKFQVYDLGFGYNAIILFKSGN